MSTPLSLTLPSGVRPRTLDTPRGPLAALHAGTAGPPVLLVPGWTGSKEDFLLVLAPLAEAGYAPVAIDQRGQNQSPGLDPDTLARDGGYSLAGYAEDVLAVSDLLAADAGHGRIHLVGHSFGGFVTRHAVVRRPERFASLTLLCSGQAALPEQRHPLLRGLAALIRAHGLPAAWDTKLAYEAAQGTPAPPMSPEVADFVRGRFLSNDPESLAAMSELLTALQDETERVRASGVPVLVAYGENDDGWSPADQRRLAERLGAPSVSIPDAGHSPAVEQPARTVRVLLDFWAQHGHDG